MQQNVRMKLEVQEKTKGVFCNSATLLKTPIEADLTNTNNGEQGLFHTVDLI